MGLVASNAYLAVFGAGTLVGATSVYILLRFRKSLQSVWHPGMEERFEFEDPKDEYRLILAVRNDLKMQKGKVAAQCGHAAVAAYAKALQFSPKTLNRWLTYGGTKIAVRIDSEEEMMDLDKRARAANIMTSIIRDAGQTQVAPGTRTVMAVGPAAKSALDAVTGHLKLY